MVKIDVATAIMNLIDYLTARDLVANSFGVDELVAAALTAKTGSDLVITNATGKDLKVEFSDAAGARKLIFYDSDDQEVGSIDSNGLITAAGGFAGALVGNVTGNLTQSGADIVITAPGTYDAIIKLGDAIGAKKLYIKDSANATQVTIDSDGTLTAKKLVGPVTLATSDTSGAPTNAECVSAFGAAATVGAGFIGVYLDSHESGKTYLCISNGATYVTVEGTAAA